MMQRHCGMAGPALRTGAFVKPTGYVRKFANEGG
jgi:hypothetical protein